MSRSPLASACNREASSEVEVAAAIRSEIPSIQRIDMTTGNANGHLDGLRHRAQVISRATQRYARSRGRHPSIGAAPNRVVESSVFPSTVAKDSFENAMPEAPEAYTSSDSSKIAGRSTPKKANRRPVIGRGVVG